MKNEDEIKNYDNSEDIRALLFANKLHNRLETNKKLDSLLNKYQLFYLKINFYKYLLIFIYSFILIFEKPEWCNNDKLFKKNDCEKDIYGSKYNLIINTYIGSKNLNYLLIFIMIVLIILIYLEYLNFNYESYKFYLKKKFINLLIILIIYIIFFILKIFNKFNLSLNFIRILFLVFFFDSFYDSILRIGKLIYISRMIFFLYIINLLFFASLGRCLFYKTDFDKKEDYYTFNFNSFVNGFITLFILSTADNYGNLPEIANKSNLFSLYIIVYDYFTSIVLLSLLTGILYFHFKKHYTDRFEKLKFEYQKLNYLINCMLKDEILNEVHLKRVEISLKNKKKDKKLNMNLVNSARQKIKKVIILINKIIKINEVNEIKNDKLIYDKFVNFTIYKIILFICNLIIFISPILILEQPDINYSFIYYKIVDFISFILIIDKYIKYKFYGFNEIIKFINILDIISSILVILGSNIILFIPIELFNKNLFIFRFWSLFCFIKIFNCHYILSKFFANYRIVLIVILKILPVLKDVITMLLVIILIYSLIGMELFGGLINSKFVIEYKKITNNDLTTNYELWHFNDLISSIIFLISLQFLSDWTNMHNILLTSKNDKGYFLKLIYRLYFYSFIFIIVFIFTNIIIGFILEFFNIFLELNKKKKIKDKNKKKDIIDMITD